MSCVVLPSSVLFLCLRLSFLFLEASGRKKKKSLPTRREINVFWRGKGGREGEREGGGLTLTLTLTLALALTLTLALALTLTLLTLTLNPKP